MRYSDIIIELAQRIQNEGDKDLSCNFIIRMDCGKIEILS